MKKLSSLLALFFCLLVNFRAFSQSNFTFEDGLTFKVDSIQIMIKELRTQNQEQSTGSDIQIRRKFILDYFSKTNDTLFIFLPENYIFIPDKEEENKTVIEVVEVVEEGIDFSINKSTYFHKEEILGKSIPVAYTKGNRKLIILRM